MDQERPAKSSKAIWIGLLIVVLVFFTPLRAVIFVPVAIIMMMLEPRPEEVVKTGQPIVQAISDYRSDHGVYPRKLDELVPDYLPKREKDGWFWNVEQTDLYHRGGAPHSYVHFYFDGHYRFTNEWYYAGDSSGRRLKIPGPKPKGPSLSLEDQFAMQLKGRENRISRSPTETKFYADKINFLALSGETELMREECHRAAALFPDWWFPELVLAETEDTNYTARFEAWIQTHDTFNNHWFLSRLHRDRDNVPAALEALKRGLNSRVIRHPGDSQWDSTYMCWDAFKFAYENRNYDLALQISERWETNGRAQGENDWLEFRAAAKLALGQFDSAQADANRYANSVREYEFHHDTAENLLEAIQSRNTNYIHQVRPPNDRAWVLFSQPSP